MEDNTEITSDAELDCVGFYCPMPIAMTKEEELAARGRTFKRLLKEFHEKAGKKGKPTKKEEEEVLRELKEIRRDLWKKYEKKIGRMDGEKRTGVTRCAAEGCTEQVFYVWVDAYLAGDGSIMERGELACYPMCSTHDGKMHDAIKRMCATPSRRLENRIRIKG